ncbi:MAG: Mrp/NBP35 family ATP-binding protein [Kiritimatiellia bacterium]
MSDCDHNCETCASKGSCSEPKEDVIGPTLAAIQHIFIVLSGKGGVGKSTVAANLAMGLALRGKAVGILDVDVHGPSIPKILGLQGQRAMSDGEKLLPIEMGNLKVMSTGLIIEKDDAPIVWRGPMKAGVIKQFIGDVRWGALDYLIVDCPPGTGDEPLSVCQLMPEADGAILVTTPQQVATLDVGKSVMFCKQIGMPILGLIENMSGFTCPHCGEFTPIFSTGGGEALAQKYEIPFLGKLPIATEIGVSGDEGQPFVSRFEGQAAAQCFMKMVDALRAMSEV